MIAHAATRGNRTWRHLRARWRAVWSDSQPDMAALGAAASPSPPAPDAAGSFGALRQQYLYANQHRELILVLGCLALSIYDVFGERHPPRLLLTLLVLWPALNLSLPYAGRRLEQYRHLLWLIWAQLFLEMLIITGILYLAGAQHPGIALYFFTLVYAYLVLPRNQAHLLAGCALLDYAALTWSLSSWLPPSKPLYPGIAYELAALLLVVFSISRMANLLRLRAKALVSSNRDLARTSYKLELFQRGLQALVSRRTADLARANHELQRHHEELLKLYKLQARFVGNISHEMCTPLTSIRAYTELLQSEPPEPPAMQRKFVEIIQGESLRLELLILDLLELAGMQAGLTIMQQKQVRLEEVVLNAAEQMRSSAARAQTELQVELRDENLPPLTGDEKRLLQVLIRLLRNALQFAPGGQVRLGAGIERGELRCWVTDSGPGIAVAEREKIFDRFYQISEEQQPKPRGAGLGLSICREIIERHGGRIWVEDSAPAGSRFVCAFPLPAKAAQAERAGGTRALYNDNA